MINLCFFLFFQSRKKKKLRLLKKERTKGIVNCRLVYSLVTGVKKHWVGCQAIVDKTKFRCTYREEHGGKRQEEERWNKGECVRSMI